MDSMLYSYGIISTFFVLMGQYVLFLKGTVFSASFFLNGTVFSLVMGTVFLTETVAFIPNGAACGYCFSS